MSHHSPNSRRHLVPTGTRSRKQSSSSSSSPTGGVGTPNSTRSVMFDDRDPLLPPRNRQNYGAGRQQHHNTRTQHNTPSPSKNFLLKSLEIAKIGVTNNIIELNDAT